VEGAAVSDFFGDRLDRHRGQLEERVIDRKLPVPRACADRVARKTSRSACEFLQISKFGAGRASRAARREHLLA
jgi:hypothetical protein